MNNKLLKYLFIVTNLTVFGVFFAGCGIDKETTIAINKAYFIGIWNLKQKEHMYHFTTGDFLVNDTYLDELVYDFGENDTLTITYCGNSVWRGPWSYEDNLLMMPTLEDERVYVDRIIGIWKVRKISDSKYVAETNGSVSTSDINGKPIEYRETYTYTFETNKIIK